MTWKEETVMKKIRNQTESEPMAGNHQGQLGLGLLVLGRKRGARLVAGKTRMELDI